ncbi:hypothetical protein [Methylomonas rosea]|uniref:Uncharacterized protein n=1 Tax=Methylomonas rosea TaxID=2952227 RepID=A0ABT1TXL3_9GAMM|nr:hypothetical protein [Methylomonas sp. WSC-7]MCQ8119499.1 hypothetical protein [Methylomonas sp. WSC-7]
MSTLAADSVAIHRLTVRAGQQRTADNLRDTLQSANWPQAGPDSWVFIRRLQVSGAARQLPRQLLDQTRQHLNTSNNPDQVMRFASLAELLAALLTDLLQGRAGFKWYWRRWAHCFDLPVSRAISGLLSEHLTLLPSISVRLAQRGELAAVWSSLSDGGARQLAEELAGQLGFRLPDRAAIEMAAAWEHDHEALDLPGIRLELCAAPGRIPSALLSRWHALLADLAVTDGRYQLAILLIAQEIAPLLLQQRPAEVLAALFGYFEQTMPEPIWEADNAVKAASRTDAQTEAMAKPQLANLSRQIPGQTENLQSVTAHAESAPAVAGSKYLKAPHSAEQANPAAEPIQPSYQSALAVDSDPRPAAEAAIFLDRLSTDSQTADPAFARFQTRQGGLLYLLNMLNRAELRAVMQQHAATLPSGWAWLYLLGQELQLDEEDALVDFISMQLGLDSREQLALLPKLPARAQLLNLAERWYGKTGVWQPELLALSAQIHYSPSHIDLYAPMNAIRLPVRLAGLDINPDWLPWLGRVVSFHYD